MNTDFFKKQAQEMHDFEEKQKHEKEIFVEKQKKQLEREKLREKAKKDREAFEKEMHKYLMDSYGFNQKTAELVYNRAWDDGHSCGYNEVRNYVEDYADWVNELLNAQK